MEFHEYNPPKLQFYSQFFCIHVRLHYMIERNDVRLQSASKNCRDTNGQKASSKLSQPLKMLKYPFLIVKFTRLHRGIKTFNFSIANFFLRHQTVLLDVLCVIAHPGCARLEENLIHCSKNPLKHDLIITV